VNGILNGWTGVSGKRVVMTGATSGIGLAAAAKLAALGAKVTVIARNESTAQTVAASTGADVVIADLAVRTDVRRAAAEILARHERIDILVNNCGTYQTSRTLTENGLETTWAVNHLASFALTNLLLEKIKAGAPARIVNTASDAHAGAAIPFDDFDGERAYATRSVAGPGFVRYGQTKLANILFTRELSRRLQGTGVTANCFHPGLVATGITRNLRGVARVTMKVVDMFSRRPEKGAETLVWLVDSPEVSDVTGAYFVDKKEVLPAPQARDAEAARRLWEVSLIQTGLQLAPGGAVAAP
jgi:NAD(P)-dependent dehydrogenase (short-subunit alcohol dehydrogenase family)